jgi:outer membrane protein
MSQKANYMLKIRILLVVSAIALSILLFSLPRAVVKNPSADDDRPLSSEHISEGPLVFSTEELEKIKALTESFRKNTITEKNAIFADSLATLYAERGLYDSAAWYYGWVADHTNNIPAILKAGNLYYEAFETAMTEEKAKEFGAKARRYLEQYLKVDPKSADAKAKLAMTYVAADNAMKGINMLVELVEEHPENEAALFNLSVLSIQISQYQKAVERLEKLVEINPHHVNAHFYLGIGYMELKNTTKARDHFQRAKALSKDPTVHAAVDNYLDNIKNK